MKIIKLFLIIIFLNIYCYANNNTTNKKITLGISLKSGLLTKFKDANVAITTWVAQAGRMHDVDVKVILYDEDNNIYNDYVNKKLDVAIVDIPFYFRNKIDLDKNTINRWGLSVDDEKFSQYYLIGSSSNLKGFSDLKSKTLALKDKDSLAEIWLEKNSFLQNKKTSKNVLKDLKVEKDDRRVIFDVYFGKADYGIVSKKAWEVIVNFNPSIEKKVKILETSQNIFMQNMGLYSKYSNEEIRKLFFEKSNNLTQLVGAKKIIDMLKFNYIYKIDDSFLEDLEKYFNEYLELEKRYN